MNLRENLFGSGPRGGARRDDQYGSPQPPRSSQGSGPGGYAPSQGYPSSPQPPPRQSVPQRRPVEGGRSPGMPPRQLRIAKVEDKTLANQYIFGNL